MRNSNVFATCSAAEQFFPVDLWTQVHLFCIDYAFQQALGLFPLVKWKGAKESEAFFVHTFPNLRIQRLAVLSHAYIL